MKSLRLLFFLLSTGYCLLATAWAATPIVDAKLTGTAHVTSGNTLQIDSGATFTIASGGTFSGAQASDATLTALAGLTTGANKIPIFTGTDTASTIIASAYTQALLPLSTSTEWFDTVAPSTPAAGDIIQYDGSHWTKVSLGALSTGLVKITTATGALSTAVSGTDYVPAGLITASSLTMPSGYLLGRSTASTGAIEIMTPSAALDLIGSTRGSILYRGATDWTALTPGTSGYVLTSSGAGADPIFAAPSGGFANPMITAGDLIIGGTSGAATRLAAGTNGYVLTLASGSPTWAAASGSSLPSQAGNSGKFLTTDGTSPLWSTPAGAGDVVGPSSSVDNRLAIFSSTTGKLLKDSTTLTASGATLSGSEIFLNTTRLGIGQASASVPLDLIGTHVSGIGIARFKGDAGSGYISIDTASSGESGFLLSTGGTLVGQVGADSSKVFIKNRLFGTGYMATFESSGTIAFPSYGAGTLTTDASGNVTASSDARLKTIDADFTRGLSDLRKITPKLYHWRHDSGLDPVNQYAGLIAQNVQAAIPEAVGTDSKGMLSLSDRPLIAAQINAIKELDARVTKLERERWLFVAAIAAFFIFQFVALRHSRRRPCCARD